MEEDIQNFLDKFKDEKSNQPNLSEYKDSLERWTRQYAGSYVVSEHLAKTIKEAIKKNAGLDAEAEISLHTIEGSALFGNMIFCHTKKGFGTDRFLMINVDTGKIEKEFPDAAAMKNHLSDEKASEEAALEVGQQMLSHIDNLYNTQGLSAVIEYFERLLNNPLNAKANLPYKELEEKLKKYGSGKTPAQDITALINLQRKLGLHAAKKATQ